ncbi:DUF885 domain-containing protein [Vitiosangium sp. GDMCC 1.1324]|uniref:DUF885 domain-containing protein n=1 Tax=Vitiosangium sp. (strain GDMCC 1.1324) TaxID=2138576 RepID=UPI000D398E57|nr:DUF885 domain-containing protein [Vitiosangium sp. GDMCC 1.1324]PTL78412.1 hypothetical protein DAT35_38405 [Vitiosangium sp. GDMCC 1.1324]
MSKALSPALDTFVRLRASFFERYLQSQPEEATTLGLHDLDDRLKDLSPSALGDEYALHRDTLAQLEQLPPEELPPEAQLDRLAMLGITRFHVHSHEELRGHRRNVELSTYPHTMLQYQIGQAETAEDWSAIASRAARIPTFLQQQEQLLAEGLATGEVPDRHVVQDFAEDQLPAIVRYFEHLPALPEAHQVELSSAGTRALQHAARDAREAFAAHHRFLRERVQPRAHPGVVLGEDEYRWRLRHLFGITDSPDALVRQAEHVLARAQGDIVLLGSRLGTPLANLAEARALLSRLESEHPAQDEDIIPLYRGLIERAEAFVHERELFNVPEGYRLGLKALPPGMVDVRGTNWPAPLLDPRKPGWFVLAPMAAAHPTVWAALLAVHEGIPGHFLQSIAWQRAFSRHPAPVRFLLVTDHVAMARGHFGPMLNIEGYATYAEERMRRAGFYSDPEALTALVARALRAVRVVVDIGLHTRRMDDETAVHYLVHSACMPEPNARREILRYKRIPMQAITYLLGALEFERLEEDCRRERGDRFDEARFHDELFSFGPVPPALLRRFMLGAP